MRTYSPLLFSVVREDPRLEERLLDRLEPGEKRFFGVAGAGCTLLQLASRDDLTHLVGTNHDWRHTTWARLRLAAAHQLSRKDFCRLNGISQIDPSAREALINKVGQTLSPEDRAFLKNERAFFAGGAFDEGAFERLIGCWRGFIERFVISREGIQRFFDGDQTVTAAMFASELWPVSFEMSFHQRLLLALFGRQAMLHAPPGSYPRYFQARFENAMARPDARANPFLSHVLRGRYGALDHADAMPDFLQTPRYEKLGKAVSKIACYSGRVVDALAAHPGPYHLIQLSNVLDWSGDADSDQMAEPVLRNLAPGGYLLLRQINSVRPLPRSWMKALDFDPALERELLAADRSFFYSAIRVGRKPK